MRTERADGKGVSGSGGPGKFLKNYGKLLFAFKHSVRLGNCFMGILMVWVSAWVVLGAQLFEHIPTVVSAGLVAFFLMAGGNMFNDVFDSSIDAVAHPTRAIPRGLFSRRFLGLWALFFYLLALFFAASINLQCFLFALGAELILLLYERYLKYFPFLGNLFIGLLIGSVFLGAAAALGGWAELSILGALGALINIAREIIKDVEDMKGDRGRSTLPRKFGVSVSLCIAASILIGVMVLAFLPWYPLRIFGGYLYPLFIFIVDLTMIYCIVISRKRTKRSQQLLKFAMLMALAAFVLGNIL